MERVTERESLCDERENEWDKGRRKQKMFFQMFAVEILPDSALFWEHQKPTTVLV